MKKCKPLPLYPLASLHFVRFRPLLLQTHMSPALRAFVQEELERPCRYCESGEKHPLFVYLLSDKRCVNNPKLHRIVPYVGISSHPLVRLNAHNRLNCKLFGNGNQLTKAGSGHYQLELVFGPLSRGSPGLGRAFRDSCRQKSRKIRSRILRFCDSVGCLQREGRQRDALLYARDPGLIKQMYQQRAAVQSMQALSPVPQDSPPDEDD